MTDLVERLVEDAISVCQPENGDERAKSYTRSVLAKKFAARIRELEALLREHHQWHMQSGVIGLQDGDGGWVEIDNAAEYSDSLMYERTEKALAGMPPHEAGPMPRGGVQHWWWQVGVLERRKRRALEAENVSLRSGRVREAIARTISESYGEDPDAFAPLTTMCTADNQPVPYWRVYEEQADAIIAKIEGGTRDGR